jgi:hypothetical protein
MEPVSAGSQMLRNFRSKRHQRLFASKQMAMDGRILVIPRNICIFWRLDAFMNSKETKKVQPQSHRDRRAADTSLFFTRESFAGRSIDFSPMSNVKDESSSNYGQWSHSGCKGRLVPINRSSLLAPSAAYADFGANL